MGRLFDGTCRLCGDEYGGVGISSHIKRCLADHANEAAVHHGLLVGVRANGMAGRFWMYLLIRPEASLEDFDRALREIWFEAGDRPSVFDIEETQYLSSLTGDDEEAPVESMAVDIGATIRPRMEFGYLYDPQQPTELEFTVYDPYPCPASLVSEDEDNSVVALARNDDPELQCSTCEEAATLICPFCATADEHPPDDQEQDSEDESPELGPFVCPDCRSKHSDHAPRLCPLTNSPRAGIC